jgi:hypothetical protein
MKTSLDREHLSLLLHRGAQLQKWQVDQLAEAALRDSVSLEDRLILASSTKLDLRARAQHLLWIIRNAPNLDFGGLPMAIEFWQFADDRLAAARATWEEVLEGDPVAPAVARNAAASLVTTDPTFGEAIYHRYQQAEPLNPAWRRGLAELYETLAEMSPFTAALPAPRPRALASAPLARAVIGTLAMPERLRDRAALARLALSNYLAAFVLMGADDARLVLVWPMRQCAAAAGDTYLRDILRSLDRSPIAPRGQ